MYDAIIIGGGIAAFGAALYCGRFQLKTLVLADKLGGTIILTDDISNYPGFKKISGLDLFDKVKDHAMDYDIELKEEKAIKVEKCPQCFEVSTKSASFKTKTIIFATGTVWKKLEAKGEAEFENKGVHYCALCDGPLYKDKTIAIVGGSDSAAKESLLLAQYAKKVYIIYRKGKIRAEPANLQRVESSSRLEIINNTNIKEIKGNKMLQSVILDKPYNGSNELKLDAVFVAIGHTPLSTLAGQIGAKIDTKGYIITNEDAQTNIRGIYACGDVTSSKFKQAITGVACGVTAAYNVYQYIKNDMPVCGCSEDN
jgi:thioredoxin reductase (NADPH)